MATKEIRPPGRASTTPSATAGRPRRGAPKAAASAESASGDVAVKPSRPKAAPARKAKSSTTPNAPDFKTTPVRIFQIFYEPWQRDLIDPEFIALDNTGKPTEYLEFELFERLSISEHVADARLWGALSWRFTEKTGLTGTMLRAAIERNPDCDLYYCNPSPQHEALYHNLWLQGETSHPRFAELARAFLMAAGLPDETVAIVPSTLYSTANYFVGTSAFWSIYLRFVRSAIVTADRKLPPEIHEALHSRAADDRNLHGGASYMPFIVERLFSLFMQTAGRSLKVHKLALPIPEEDINVHLKLLREMKDAAWKARSPWLAACWVNYRNLYLSQQHGQIWAKKYLRAVTPEEIRFA